jgi:hypothetical protein
MTEQEDKIQEHFVHSAFNEKVWLIACEKKIVILYAFVVLNS